MTGALEFLFCFQPVRSATQVRAYGRERINAGRLPETMPSLISAGYGAGAAVCALCDVEILSDHAMYKVDDPRGLDEALTFHFPCYVIWQCECGQG